MLTYLRRRNTLARVQHPKNPASVGARLLRSKVDELGLTLVAQEINVARSTVWRWASEDTIPSVYFAVILRDIYAIPIDAWVTDDGPARER